MRLCLPEGDYTEYTNVKQEKNLNQGNTETTIVLKESERFNMMGTLVNGQWMPFDIRILINRYKKSNQEYKIIH